VVDWLFMCCFVSLVIMMCVVVPHMRTTDDLSHSLAHNEHLPCLTCSSNQAQQVRQHKLASAVCIASGRTLLIECTVCAVQAPSVLRPAHARAFRRHQEGHGDSSG
jgi:hypothetical protein